MVPQKQSDDNLSGDRSLNNALKKFMLTMKIKKSLASTTKECTLRFILDAGSSGTGGALGLDTGSEMQKLELWVKKGDKDVNELKVLRPEPLRDGVDVATYQKDELKNYTADQAEVIKILDNNLKLSYVTDDIKTATYWSNAAKVHITKFYKTVKDKIKTHATVVANCNNIADDKMLDMKKMKVWMGATAGMRNVVNAQILKDKATQFEASIKQMEKDFSGFFKEFKFGYIAGRTEGMFGSIVGLGKPDNAGKKIIQVEMGGASTQVAFETIATKYQFTKSETRGPVKANGKQYFSQSWLGNACDRGPASLVMNYVRGIVKEINFKVDDKLEDTQKLANDVLTIDNPCMNPESKLVYEKGKFFSLSVKGTDPAPKDAKATDCKPGIECKPGPKVVGDNQNKFMDNLTLYGLWANDFNRHTSITINGTGDYTKCKVLVDKFLLGDSDDEQIDHVELKKVEAEMKDLKMSTTAADKLAEEMEKNDKEHASLSLNKTQKQQYEQLSTNIKGSNTFEKIILMTNAWSSMLGEKKPSDGLTVSKICTKLKVKGMTLKDMEGCLVDLCKAPTTSDYNYALCTISVNLHGILKVIATAINSAKPDDVVVERVDSEWSEGPFMMPSKVFDNMKEDLFQGRGSKAFENEKKDYGP